MDVSVFHVLLVLTGASSQVGGWTAGTYLYLCVFVVFFVALVNMACEDLWKYMNSPQAIQKWLD